MLMDRIYLFLAEGSSMTITSFFFFSFLFIGVLVYYLCPPKIQWVVLLFLSIVFYSFATQPYTIIFLIISTLIAYFSTRFISKNTSNPKYTKLVSFIAVSSVIINVLLWFLLKGSSFWIYGSSLIQNLIPSFPVLSSLPIVGSLGMGYYTAQIISYILDVYWGSIECQNNPVKLFLFVSYFPQLTVGPISRYSDLQTLFDGHSFSYKNICFGSQRVVWGLFKKLVVAERIAVIVNGIWENTETYFGVWPWLAFLLYPLELYLDFSGCMDIVAGTSEMFDIHLTENFNNPFFSRTVQEFWQRWHITLGSWARDYVFYPFLKSERMVSFGKKCKKKCGKRWGKFLPWCIATAILWLVMGIWHGAVQHIFGVSLWFWFVLVLGELLSPLFEEKKRILNVKSDSFGWHLFQSVRTYLIFSVGVVFFSASGIRSAIERYSILFSSLKKLKPWTLFDDTIISLGVTWGDINIIIIGVVLLLTVGVLRNKHGYARLWVEKQSFGLRWLIWCFLFVFVLIFGMYGPGYDASVFIYQGF